MSFLIDNRTEWLEVDGLGGFASGTTTGERTRRYHALLLAATKPPTGRMVLVSGFDAWVETPGGRYAISSQRYQPDIVYPDGATRIVDFELAPWPTWTYRLTDSLAIRQELFVPQGISACCMRWQLVDSNRQTGPATLIVRPFFCGRDYHSLHHENGAFNFEPHARDNWLWWHPYEGVPEIGVWTNGEYVHEPEWFQQFLYAEEQTRGLDAIEDLASPGSLKWDLSHDAVLMCVSAGHDAAIRESGSTPEASISSLAEREQNRRKAFPTPLHRSADAYLVKRGAGKTIIAGYPWFTDWGRDTFISLRGLCIATGRLDDARDILLAWAAAVSEGMLPNRFPDVGDQPEFNSVDASLWFTIAVHDLITAMGHGGRQLTPADRQALEAAVLAIVEGYSRGTRFSIHADRDGLLAAGEEGVQLTWMDAKFDDHVVTPRIGKPVEVQALWLNALWIAGRIDGQWIQKFQNARAEFERRFWNPSLDCLFDVVDVDHRPGVVDTSLRPNQIFAVGGLPLALLHGERARNVVDAVEARLHTPLGLRTLSPNSPGYQAHYHGDRKSRDEAYHQGTAWPWLMGPFVEAWVRVRGGTQAAKQQARERFLQPFWAHLQTAGLNHVSEITDAESPFTPQGCPFQAWSLGEFLRLIYGGVL